MPTEALGLFGMSLDGSEHTAPRYIHKAMLNRNYASYLESQREYLGKMHTFFTQIYDVLVTVAALRRMKEGDPNRAQQIELIRNLGRRPNMNHLSTLNFWDAIRRLHDFQNVFRQLFGSFVSGDELATLEQRENEILDTTWIYWYFFANQPHRIVANSRRKLLVDCKSEKWSIDRLIDKVIVQASAEDAGSTRSRLETEFQWKGDSALWLSVDVEHALDYYAVIEGLFTRLNEAFGEKDYWSLRHYMLRKHYCYLVVGYPAR